MTLIDRRAFVRTAALLPALALPGIAAAQAQWPSGQITFVVPFPPGGSVDAIARIVEAHVRPRLGAPIVVLNRPGASGSIATRDVAKAAADGNTWLFVFDNHAVNPSLYPNLGFDTEKDLDAVMLIGTAPYVVATHPSRPWRNLADLLKAAKEKPGTITYASVGTGTLSHLFMARLGKVADAKFNHVPYRGGGPAINDAIAGHVDLIVASIAVLSAQLAAGTLIPVMQTGERRAATIAGTETIGEAGFKGLETYASWAVFAPAGTPKQIIDRMHLELSTTFKDPVISKQLGETQQIQIRATGPDELRQFVSDQIKVWAEVIRENGIKPEG
jgi:tripartite-type tricarboxylate transporter receptor subunit TctC